MRLKISWHLFLMCVVLFSLVLILFVRTGTFDFVNLDDWKYVSECPWLRDGITRVSFINCFTEFRDTGCWFPLTRLSYLSDVAFFGLNPGAMHIHNSILHGFNAVLVFIFLRMSLKKRLNSMPPSAQAAKFDEVILGGAVALGTLFWALHPLRVESVAWISSRKDLLSLFWELLALMAWIKGMDSPLKRYVLFPVLFFILAMMAKPTAITFVVLVALLDLFLLGQFRWRRYLPLALLTLPLIVVSIYTQHIVRGNDVNCTLYVPLYGRFVQGIASVGLYLVQTCWPVNLHVPALYQWPQMPECFWFGLVVCIVTCGVLVRYRWFMFCMLGYLVALSPMLGIVSFGFQAHADRFTYLPSLYLAAGIAGALYWVSQRNRAVACAGWGLMVLYCMALTWGSVQQLSYWQDTETLSRRALQCEPDNMIAHKNLGAHLFLKRQRLEEAEIHFERAMALHRDALTYSVGITLFIADGNMKRATAMSEQFMKTVRERENQGWKVHACMAEAFQAYCQGNGSLAEDNFKVISLKNPTFAPAFYMLGKIALKRGDAAVAEKYWTLARQDVMFRNWL
ncbi:MAG: tetratricopeptide repeat protein [bacterium]